MTELLRPDIKRGVAGKQQELVEDRLMQDGYKPDLPNANEQRDAAKRLFSIYQSMGDVIGQRIHGTRPIKFLDSRRETYVADTIKPIAGGSGKRTKEAITKKNRFARLRRKQLAQNELTTEELVEMMELDGWLTQNTDWWNPHHVYPPRPILGGGWLTRTRGRDTENKEPVHQESRRPRGVPPREKLLELSERKLRQLIHTYGKQSVLQEMYGLNWREVEHPTAGNIEEYLYQGEMTEGGLPRQRRKHKK